ncbi:uncharacterized protein KLLA0_E02157g [Kluyveromyces lactis]|uniref:KLLA0E02157p n=1 Tax=Kluyveromyces lactis (strain ATCC 8585 / CBS 2359 / DSM 70799 / NBRC 1267 / NRRL Y-1140 / WM37) TaxID=284590 RepID=Q6CPU4_KLULA|nr:uncharacterized protein KLLA0_E02157g [Kluyveromyces lactis]CAG99132.1 KLLA0E02157p [Kluyveromyces lactis]|eukprot:XP_454045.1 uncharacterized protein KLLA0_E02157g [Kluyveromyces lactis]
MTSIFLQITWTTTTTSFFFSSSISQISCTPQECQLTERRCREKLSAKASTNLLYTELVSDTTARHFPSTANPKSGYRWNLFETSHPLTSFTTIDRPERLYQDVHDPAEIGPSLPTQRLTQFQP